MHRLGPILVVAGLCASAWGQGFEAHVRIENRTGQDKTDWPVFLTVWKVFGPNLPPGRLNPRGFHVFGPDGSEVPHMLRRLPPDFSLGNDEIVFLVPALPAGASLSYRITNTRAPGKTVRLDLAGNPNNLLPNSGFEKGEAGAPAGWRITARKGAKVSLDARQKRSGRRALLLTLPINSSATVRTDRPIRFRKGQRYHFSIWARSENVAYNGYGFWNSGVSIRFEPAALRGRASLTVRGDRR